MAILRALTIFFIVCFLGIRCKDRALPPDGGKPGDWIEMRKTTLSAHFGNFMFPYTVHCSKDYKLITDSATYHCYGFHKNYGEIDFDKYNVAWEVVGGSSGYATKSYEARIWMNMNLKVWTIVVAFTSEKASASSSDGGWFIFKIPKIPAGFKRI